jgi:GntR family transcriptional regulator/MocR family aminotransferase
MRARYRARRDALIETLAESLPEADVCGIAAGLHATVRLPAGHDEQAIAEEALRRGVALQPMSHYRLGSGADHPPTLVLAYAEQSEPAIRAGIRELAATIDALRVPV